MANKNKRFCVFCGEKPVSKSNEHVIPLWLIKLTGDPKRLIRIGPLINNKERGLLEIPFDQFQFPACVKCNEQFGELEDSVKPVIENLIAFKEVSSADMDVLLDWFDKVRIGLWLGYHQLLDKNYWKIIPNFHISDRIGMKDRAIIIYRSRDQSKRINFTGVNTPAFAHSPTCFTLTINNLCFTNISCDFLLAKRSGLPYPKTIFVNWENQILIRLPLIAGSETYRYPVLGYNYDRRSTVIAQPIFERFAASIPNYYETDYVRTMSIKSGRFKPLIQKRNVVNLYPNYATSDWLPDETHDTEWLLNRIYTQTLQLQIEQLRRLHVERSEDIERKKGVKYNIIQCIKANQLLLSHFKSK